MRAVLAPCVLALVSCTSSAATTRSGTTTAVATTAAMPTAGGSASAGSACARTPEEARAQVAQLEQEWETAFYRRDSAFFARTLAEDFRMAGGPAVGGRREYIADLVRASAVPSTITGSVPPLEEVRALGNDVVVVSGIWTNKAAPTERAAYTEVFQCRDGRWRAVHGHYNSLAPADR